MPLPESRINRDGEDVHPVLREAIEGVCQRIYEHIEHIEHKFSQLPQDLTEQGKIGRLVRRERWCHACGALTIHETAPSSRCVRCTAYPPVVTCPASGASPSPSNTLLRPQSARGLKLSAAGSGKANGLGLKGRAAGCFPAHFAAFIGTVAAAPSLTASRVRGSFAVAAGASQALTT